MNLDINSPKGQEAARLAREAIAHICASESGNGTDLNFFQMADSGPEAAAAIDGFFVRGGTITSAAEVKCRTFTEQEFWGTFQGEWLITAQKVHDLRAICDLLKIPGIVILYIIPSKVILIKHLITNRGFVIGEHRRVMTETRATINGGMVERENMFVDMRGAKRYQV